MPRWGLIVEQNLGFGGQRRVWSADVLGHVDGTREEALEALRVRAETYAPTHPFSPRRRRIYREQDGFLLVLDGSWQSFHCRFTVAEQLLDSAAPEPRPAPDPAPEEEPEPSAPAPVRRTPPPPPEPPKAWDADVPEVPSWFGREDLS
ncbi:hypothetical protein [Streptomyces sp. SID14515]|uniref:hypothetical protein n=1 Tax=Streptomyces sp. SID14515 TaxID=2706074 RepID=UPI0013C844F7|nr:hypothetical protein [Streptomyces sp. SID14515]NEB39315.1 hypothetical protein [Streptomyces sp. SID14515]